MNKRDTIRLQRKINDAGFGTLKVDGVYGPKTAAAYEDMIQASDVGGAGAEMPVPAPATPWWRHPALISGVATIIASALQFYNVPVSASMIEGFVLALTGTITGGLALYAAFSKNSSVDRTLVMPGVRVPSLGMRNRTLSPDSLGSPNTTRPMDDRGPFFPD